MNNKIKTYKTINYKGTFIGLSRTSTKFGILYKAEIAGEPWMDESVYFKTEKEAIKNCIENNQF